MSLSELRADVYAVLIGDAVLTGLLPPEQIHAYVPTELATPAVWIESPIELAAYDVAELLATLGVLIVVDGAEQSALATLEDIEGAVWVALEQLGTAAAATGVLLGAGGPTLHAVRVAFEVTISARTLCPPALLAT